MTYSLSVKPLIHCTIEEDAVINFGITELEKYSLKIFNKLTDSRDTERLAALKINLVDKLEQNPTPLPTEYDQFIKTNQKDAYGILAVGDEFYLFGKSSRAILYAIYEFIKKLGVRWYFPGKKKEIFPRRLPEFSKFDLKVHIPKLSTRGILVSGTVKNIRMWIDYAAKNRLNSVYISNKKYFYTVSMDAIVRGLVLEIQSPFYSPEWCTSVPKSLNNAKTILLEEIRELPNSLRNIYCWPTKRYVERCSCRIDKNFHSSDLLLHQLNQLSRLKKISKHDRKLVFVAQLGTWFVPNQVRPSDKIVLELNPVHRCFSHSIADPFCKHNSKHILPEMKGFLKHFGNERSIILESWLDSELFGRTEFEYFGWANFPLKGGGIGQSSGQGRVPNIPRIMQRDIKYYLSHQIQHIICNASGIDELYLQKFTSPMIFLYPELSWDPDQDVEELLKNFTNEYFGTKKWQMFFDEAELIDPKDLTWEDFSRYIGLCDQRIKLLGIYLEKPISVKIKNRVRKFLEEQKLKSLWKINFVGARTLGYFNHLYFQYKRSRC